MGTLLDCYSTGSGLASSTLANTEFTAVSVGASATLTTSSSVTRALQLYSLQASTGASSVVSYGERDWGSDQLTVYAELYVRFNAVPAAITSYFSIVNSATAGVIDLRVNASGNWSCYNYGNTTTYTSTGPVLLAQKWYRIELKLFSDGAAGTIDIKVNGVLEPGLNAISGINTKPGNGPRRWRAGVTVAQASAGQRNFSDIMVLSDAWPGIGYVKCLQFYNSDANNWTVVGTLPSWISVQPIPWDSSTTRMLTSATASQEQHFSWAPLAQTSTGLTIHGLLPFLRLRRRLVGSAVAVNILVRSGSSDGTSTSIDPVSSSWVTKGGVIQPVDPVTGSAWTLTGINAAELKLVHDVGTNQIDINGALVYAAFSLGPPNGTINDEDSGTRTSNPNRRGKVYIPTAPSRILVPSILPDFTA